MVWNGLIFLEMQFSFVVILEMLFLDVWTILLEWINDDDDDNNSADICISSPAGVLKVAFVFN